jgi:hypothetical protein
MNYKFCPHCGKSLDNSSSHDSEFVYVDCEEFEYATYTESDFEIIVNVARESIYNLIPTLAQTNFGNRYSSIKGSKNRKSLLALVEKCITELGEVISQLPDEVIPAFADKARKIHEKYLDDIKQAGGLFLPNNDFNSDEFSVSVLYSRQQIDDFYKELLTAYKKYINCVNENNMFAAFHSDSDYPKPYKFSKNLYDNSLKKLKASNGLKYTGFLDEDFIPHVDGFWEGVRCLCHLIDNRVDVNFNIELFNLEDIREISKQETVLIGNHNGSLKAE